MSSSIQAVAAGFLSHCSGSGCRRGPRRKSRAETPFLLLSPDVQILLHPSGLSCICLHLPRMTQSHAPSGVNPKPCVYISNIKLFIILLLAAVHKTVYFAFYVCFLILDPSSLVEYLVCDKVSLNVV